VIEVSQNEIPRDKDGRPLKVGQIVIVEIVKEPPKAKIGEREFFLGPRVRRICGKLILVGKRKSVIQPETGGLSEEVVNDKISVVV
jgi:hypothetical protein